MWPILEYISGEKEKGGLGPAAWNGPYRCITHELLLGADFGMKFLYCSRRSVWHALKEVSCPYIMLCWSLSFGPVSNPSMKYLEDQVERWISFLFAQLLNLISVLPRTASVSVSSTRTRP